MIGVIDALAQFVGYIVLTIVAVIVALGLWMKYSFKSEVSPEAKQMAKEMDPNNPLEEQVTAEVFDGLLEGIRDLRPDETIRADPAPITHFDWSVDDASQEDIEHILAVLRSAGYYTHPLPDIDTWDDEGEWSRERAGIWRSEPDWYIVRFDEDGRREQKERVDLPLPEEWRPDAA